MSTQATPGLGVGSNALLGWQPIGTAPLDGSTVLLLIDHADHALHDDTYAVSIGSYGVNGGADYDPTWSFAGWDWSQDEYRRGSGTPTHWMPLPLPPNAQVQPRFCQEEKPNE